MVLTVASTSSLACGGTPDPPRFDTAHCRIYEQPALSDRGPYSYCVVYPENRPVGEAPSYYSIALTDDPSEEVDGFGYSPKAFVVVVPVNADPHEEVSFGNQTGDGHVVTLGGQYVTDTTTGSGYLQTNVDDISSGDFELSLSFAGASVGIVSITGALKIRASDQLSVATDAGGSP